MQVKECLTHVRDLNSKLANGLDPNGDEIKVRPMNILFEANFVLTSILQKGLEELVSALNTPIVAPEGADAPTLPEANATAIHVADESTLLAVLPSSPFL